MYNSKRQVCCEWPCFSVFRCVKSKFLWGLSESKFKCYPLVIPLSFVPAYDMSLLETDRHYVKILLFIRWWIIIYICWKRPTIIAIIRACACWALFVVTLTNTVHFIYIYIYGVHFTHAWCCHVDMKLNCCLAPRFCRVKKPHSNQCFSIIYVKSRIP